MQACNGCTGPDCGVARRLKTELRIKTPKAMEVALSGRSFPRPSRLRLKQRRGNGWLLSHCATWCVLLQHHSGPRAVGGA